MSDLLVQDLLEPLHDLLLVERDPDQEKIGRIYLADNSSLGKSQLGTVIKAGPRSQSYLDRRIVFSVGAGILLKSSGLLLLSPADILALIKTAEKVKTAADLLHEEQWHDEGRLAYRNGVDFKECPYYNLPGLEAYCWSQGWYSESVENKETSDAR